MSSRRGLSKVVRHVHILHPLPLDSDRELIASIARIADNCQVR